MRWNNGTVTNVQAVGMHVEIEDVSGRLKNGGESITRTIDEALDLADEHDECARLLRAAARKAQDNANAQKRENGKA